MSKATSSAAGRIGAGALAAALLAGLAPAPARAQTSAPTPDRGVAIERFRMSSDRQGVLDVEWGWTEKKGSWNATLWGNYVDDPLVVRDVDSNQRLGSPIHQRVGAAASFAYSLTDRLQLGAVLPLVLWQDGQQSIAGVPALPTQSLGAIGVGNLRLVPKVGLFRSSDGRMSLAVLAHVIIPAFQKDGYFGDKNVGVEPELAGSLAVEDLRFALNAGYRWRAGTTTLVGATLHDELTARLGVGYRFGRSAATSRTPMEVDLTLAGATAANAPFDQAVQNAGALTVAFQYDLQAPVTLFGGAGMGIAPGYGVPDTQIFAGARLWSRAGPPPAAPAPVEVDPDHDGVAGALDGCPDQAEDKDGFEDDDGCPDPDNDKDGVADATDACPAEAGPPDNKGCPDKDRDGDGVVDRADTCPDQPEDKDGFEDDDGCPDLDNDKDGVADTDDACPLEAGRPDNKGCPDKDRDGDGVVDRADNCPDEVGTKENSGCKAKQLARLTDSGIEISETVYFKVDRGIIQRKSFLLLENVAQVIRNHPEVGGIRIEGHTDSRGDDGHNQVLSENRAKAVLEFLVQKGVPRTRLTARGLGETQPLGDNRTATGRGKNRRVVFAKDGGAATGASPGGTTP